MSHFAIYDDSGNIIAITPAKVANSVMVDPSMASGFLSGAIKMADYFVAGNPGFERVTDDALDVDIQKGDDFTVVPPVTDTSVVVFRINPTMGKIRVSIPTPRTEPLAHNKNTSFDFNLVARDFSAVYGTFTVQLSDLAKKGFVEFSVDASFVANSLILTEVVFHRYGVTYEYQDSDRGSSGVALFSTRISTRKQLKSFSGILIVRDGDTIRAVSRGAEITVDQKSVDLILTSRGDFSVAIGSVELDLAKLMIDKYHVIGKVEHMDFDITAIPFTNKIAIYDGKIPHNSI